MKEFFEVKDARQYHADNGGCLIKVGAGYAVCSLDRAAILRNTSPGELAAWTAAMHAVGYDESLLSRSKGGKYTSIAGLYLDDEVDGEPVVHEYYRVSTLEQDKTCAPQVAVSDAYIRKHDVLSKLARADKYIDAATSSKIPFSQRVAGGLLMTRVKRGDHIVFAKYDRAFRSVLDSATMFELWGKLGVFPHVVNLGFDTTMIMGKAMLGVAAVFAQMERELISERIKEQKAVARKAGRVIGNFRVPCGYKLIGGVDRKHRVDQRRMVPCPDERALLVSMEAMLSQGISKEDIARNFEFYNKTPWRGKVCWDRTKVSKLLREWRLVRQLEAEGKPVSEVTYLLRK